MQGAAGGVTMSAFVRRLDTMGLLRDPLQGAPHLQLWRTNKV